MNYVYVRLIPLPTSIKGCTIPNDDFSYDVYINSVLDENQRNKALKHEIEHIKKEHFLSYDDICVIESEAEKAE